jgi:hypothetical protein
MGRFSWSESEGEESLEEVRLTWKGIVVDGDLFLLLLIVVSIFFFLVKVFLFYVVVLKKKRVENNCNGLWWINKLKIGSGSMKSPTFLAIKFSKKWKGYRLGERVKGEREREREWGSQW